MVVSLFREISEADRAVGRSRTGRTVRGRASASSGPCAGPVTPPPAGEGARCQGRGRGATKETGADCGQAGAKARADADADADADAGQA